MKFNSSSVSFFFSNTMSRVRIAFVWSFLIFAYIAVFWKWEEANANRSLSGWKFAVGFLPLFAAYFGLYFVRIRAKSERFSVICGLGVRIFLVFLTPIFEDDWARYLWDGFQSQRFGSPYGLVPEAFFQDQDPTRAEILSRINHPDWPTIYGPFLEVYFYVMHLLFPWKLWALKCFLLIPDISLFWAIRKRYGRSSGAMYWWNPILLKEVFLNGHPDLWGASFLFLAFVCLQGRRFRKGALVSGFALAVKGFGFLFLPFLVSKSLRSGFDQRKAFLLLLIAGLAPLLLYSWFLISSFQTDLGVLERFAKGFQFFPIGYSVLEFGFGSWARWVWIGSSCLLAVYLGHCRNSYGLRDEERISFPFFFFFFFSPVLNAWYLLWILPFLFPIRRSFWPGWAFLAIGQFSYLNYANLGDWPSVLEKGYYAHPSWVLWGAGIVVLVFVISWFGRKWRRRGLSQ